jgi:putative ABC transport system permease protein
MSVLWQDLRFGARTLLKNPSFTSIAVLTLALGIGANTAMFSVLNGVLLRSLPYRDPNRIVQLSTENQKRGSVNGPFSYTRFLYLQQESHAFEDLAVYANDNLNLTGSGEPEQLAAIRVSASFFNVLGVAPELGRTFSADEDQPGGNAVVVLSHSFWQARFGGDPNLAGKTVLLDDQSRTVVGVMPPGFTFPTAGADVWIPRVSEFSGLTKEQIRNGGGYLIGVARLRAGVDRAQAAIEMQSMSRQYQQGNASMTDADPNATIDVVRLQDQITQYVRPALWVLFGSVVFVLLIACVNVANLSLLRATERQRELTIRSALGASRGRIGRQLLTESLLISVTGGGLGFVLAWLGTPWVVEQWRGTLPYTAAVHLDYYVLGFSVAISILTGLLFGLAPALQNSKTDLNETLKEGSRGSTGAGHRARGALVVAEMAIALTLLVGSGLLIRSFMQLQQVTLGFNPDHLLTMLLALPPNKYATDQQKNAFFEQAQARIESLPGVRSAAFTLSLPLNNNVAAPFLLEGQAQVNPGDRPVAALVAATSNYFRTMEVPLRKGRLFTDTDRPESPHVVVIGETMARQYFGDQDPIGKRMLVGRQQQPFEIVGIVGDMRNLGLTAAPRAAIYVPYAQWTWPRMNLVVRTDGQPLGMAAAVRSQIQAIDPNEPVIQIQSMNQVIDGWVAQPRLTMILSACFATIALLLAAIGIYGVMSYSVTKRTHELGIRMALGAQTGQVLRLVVRSGMTLAIIGLALGLTGAFALTRLMNSLLFGVAPTDAVTFAIVSAVLMGVALLACYIPARRATKVDPLVALRHE